MLRIAVLACLVNASLCSAQQSIQGVVLDSLTRQPVRKAHVSLLSSHAADDSPSYGITTGETGRFSFDNLPPGDYVLSAQKLGYLGFPSPSHFSAADSDERSQHLHLSAGQQLDSVQLKLTPQGVITGRVLDHDGDPCEHCTVALFTYFWKNGKRQAEFLETGDDLDDRAVFRFSGLAAGKYFLYAKPENFFSDEKPAPGTQPDPQGPVLTYFGDATVPDRASPIPLAPGQTASDLEIRLQQSAVYSIKGSVAGLEAVHLKDDGQGTPNQQETFVSLRPQGSSDQLGNSASSLVADNGSFQLSGVPPGSYDLILAQANGSATIARTLIEVSDHNVSGLSLQVMPLQSLSGKVEIEGPGNADLSGLAINCEDDAGTAFSVRPRPDHTFTLINLSRQKYTLHVWGLPKGTYLKTVTAQGIEAAGNTLDLTAGTAPPVRILLSTQGARLYGHVKTDDVSRANHASWKIALIPDPPDPALLDLRSQTTSVDQSGAFTFDTVAPGSYQLYAFEKIDGELWQDPDFLSQLQTGAQTITLKPGQSAQVTIPLIPASRTEQILATLGLQ